MKKWIAIFIGLAAAVGLMLTATGAWIKSRQMSVAIIGGADGPTSIFVAGKINGAAFMEAGAILVAGGLGIGLLLFLVCRRRKRMKKWIAIFIGLAAAVGLMLTATGAWIKSRQMSVAIIGGADGPTSIFVAGKINGAAFMEAGAILVAGGLGIGLLLFLVFRRKRK